MRDRVWDRPQVIKANIKNTVPYDVMTVVLNGTSPRSEAIFTFRSMRSQRSNRYRLAVKIRQSTIAQRRPVRRRVQGRAAHSGR